MSDLPQLSGSEAVKAFSKAGFEKKRHRGSHAVLKKEGYPLVISVPMHKQLKPGTLRQLIRDAGLSVEDFCGLL